MIGGHQMSGIRARERIQRKQAEPSRDPASSVGVQDEPAAPEGQAAPTGVGGHALTQYAIVPQAPAPAMSAVPTGPVEALTETQPGIPDGFVPESIVNDLLRAIDQSTKTVEMDKARVIRKVDAGLVIRVLDNLTATQALAVRSLYDARAKRTNALQEDLFGGGTSETPSSLTKDQEGRIRELLRGTRIDKPGDATPTGRIGADAIELHELLSGSLNDAKRERVMALHRRPAGEIERIDSYYQGFYGGSLYAALRDKLKDLQLVRMNELRLGDWVKADACAIEDKRRAIAKLDAQPLDPFEMQENIDKRKSLVAGIESIVEQNRQEAVADPNSAGKTQAQAVQERIGAILDTRAGEGGQSVREGLEKTLKSKGGAIIAMADGSLADAAARRLLQMEETETTDTALIAPLLRGFRAQATHDIMAAMYGTQLSQSDKEMMASDPALFEQAVDSLAISYTDAFIAAYEGMRGEHRSWTAIVASAYDYNRDLLNALQEGGGEIKDDLVELDVAIRKKDVELIKAVLRRQPNKAAADDLAARYEAKRGVNLRSVLFGKMGESAAAEMDSMFTGAILSGRSAAAAQESLDKPAAFGGDAEVDWIAKHGEREKTVTEANSGAMGSLREIGDDPETQVLMNESARRLKALQAEFKANDPWGRPRGEILAEMRRMRVTLTGDATAYEEDNARMVAELRAAISFAVQIALAVALPGFPSSFLLTMATNIGANVASNMLIYGDQYSLTSFRNDVLGGVLGGLGGKFGDEFLGAVASKVSGTAAKGTIGAAERAGLSVGLAKQAGAAAGLASEAGLLVKAAKEVGNLTGGAAGSTLATGENQFTADSLFMGFFMNRLGGLRGEPAQPGAGGGETQPRASGEPAPAVTGGEQPAAPRQPTPLPDLPIPVGPALLTPAPPGGGVGGGGVPAPGGVTSQRPEPGGMVHHESGRAPGEPGLPADFGSDDFGFTAEGPQVQTPVDPSGRPANVLEIGAGPTDTNLGLAVEPGQGNQAVHDASLVDVTRTDLQPRPGAAELNASQPIPPEHWGQDAVIINNPRGYQIDIANVGQAVRPGGRIVIQGRAAVTRGMRGINPDMNPILQQALGGDVPPGFRVVEVVVLPEVRGGDPAAVQKPGDIMGGPFQRTDGGPVGWPNTRIVIERIVPVNDPVMRPAPSGRAPGDPDSPDVQQELHESIDTTIKGLDELGTGPNRNDYHVVDVHMPPKTGEASSGPEAKVIPGEPITSDQLRDTYGMPVENQRKLQEIAQKYGVEFDMRPTTKDAPALLDDQAVPKMEDLKSKTITAEDEHIGAWKEDIGKVGFFKPEPPVRPHGIDEATWQKMLPKLVERFAQRDAEYWDNAKRMTELQRRAEMQSEKSGPMDDRGTHKEQQVAIGDDGVVKAIPDEGASLKEPPFTGDHDIFDIRKADGSALSNDEYNAIIAEMRAANMGVAHGAHMRWVPQTPAEKAIFAAIVKRHASGAEPLLRFSPGADPVIALPK
jgi:hypothetical protein